MSERSLNEREPDTEVLPVTERLTVPKDDDTQMMPTTSFQQETTTEKTTPDDTMMTATVPLYSAAPPRRDESSVAPHYVQVPVAPPAERPVIQRTGPSSVTIVFGVLLMATGLVTILLAVGFPTIALSGLGIDPRIALAVLCGAFGAILVVVAMVWAVVRIVRSKRSDDDTVNPDRD